jgi:hypothetical protein
VAVVVGAEGEEAAVEVEAAAVEGHGRQQSHFGAEQNPRQRCAYQHRRCG